MKNLHLIAKGRVQGVGYRRFVVDTAREIKGISGWVRNLPNGDVEILAIGEENELNQLILKCKKGPAFSKVIEIKVDELKDNEKEELLLLGENGKFRVIF